MHPSNEENLVAVMAAALRAVDPYAAVLAHVALSNDALQIGEEKIPLSGIERIVVVGAGKAGTPMVAALQTVLGDRITGGVVSVKRGHTSSGTHWRVRFERRPDDPGANSLTANGPIGATARLATSRVKLVEAAHPVPDAAGMTAARSVRDLALSCGRNDLLVVLLSGGASALLPLPADDITLPDLQALTDLLLRSGADISEVNTVRKHCSQTAGGQLARAAAPARVVSLILSDVVGSPLGDIGSGPTVPDPTTFGDAVAVLRRYGILDEVPTRIADHLQLGTREAIADTPKPGDPLFRRATAVVVGDNQCAAKAAAQKAREFGWHGELLTTFLQGEAREVGRVMAALAQGIARGQSLRSAPVCLVLGGETTVTVRGAGKGGRNQELALAAAIALDRYDLPGALDVSVISLATDGSDGPTDAAGGRATACSVRRALHLGLDPLAALAANDSYPQLAALGDLLMTGPTQTNVNDLVFVSVLPKPQQ